MSDDPMTTDTLPALPPVATPVDTTIEPDGPEDATLIVCLLLSSAFTAEETALWALAFLESVAMQILVTNTVLSLATLVLKTAVSWALLRASRKHQRRQQAKKLSQRREVLTAEATAAVVRRTSNVERRTCLSRQLPFLLQSRLS